MDSKSEKKSATAGQIGCMQPHLNLFRNNVSIVKPVQSIASVAKGLSQKEYLINNETAKSYIIRNWLPKGVANDLHAKLASTVQFQVDNIKLGGKSIPQPRRTYACGNSEITGHHYSGATVTMHPWIPEVKEIGDLAVQLLNEEAKTSNSTAETTTVAINACLLNQYRTGSEYLGWHSDRETRGDHNHIVITVSLGGSRRFYFKKKVAPSESSAKQPLIKTELHSGDLVIMMGKVQELYAHTVPKQMKDSNKKPVQPRISLTYRFLSQH